MCIFAFYECVQLSPDPRDRGHDYLEKKTVNKSKTKRGLRCVQQAADIMFTQFLFFPRLCQQLASPMA